MHTFVVITICSIFLYPNAQGIYFRNFPQDLESKHYDFAPNGFQNDTLNIFNDSSEIINASENQTDERSLEYSSIKYNANESFRVEELNSTFSSMLPTTNITNTQSIQTETTLTSKASNETNSTSSVPFPSSTSSSTGMTKSGNKSTSIASSTNEEIIVSSTEDEEQEGVVRGTPSTTEITNNTTSKSETMYQKILASIQSDTYTLSILLPVAAGIVFASTVIVIIATCRCLKRQCRRRRLRRKTLPDSVKNLRPSDRARLLAESSDEEF